MFYQYFMYTAPSVAPMGLMAASTTSDSIKIQWTRLTDRQANGNVRWYIITCNDTFMVSTLKYFAWETLTDCLVAENWCGSYDFFG